MDSEVRNTIEELARRTGVGRAMCKEAYEYAMARNGNFNMMLAYIKAKSLASYVTPFEAKVNMFLKGLESEEK